MFRKPTFAAALAGLLLCSTLVSGQSNFDLEPPLQVDPNSNQYATSPDPSALGLFQFATIERDGDENVAIMTKTASQELLSPLANQAVSRDLDARGIPVTEMVQQTYTVAVPYTEMIDGKPVQKVRQETRTRAIPMTTFRKRNEEEQAKYEKALEKAKQEKKTEPKIKAATQESRGMKYYRVIPQTVEIDGKRTVRMKTTVVSQMIQVMTGKTRTMPKSTSEQ